MTSLMWVKRPDRGTFRGLQTLVPLYTPRSPIKRVLRDSSPAPAERHGLSVDTRRRGMIEPSWLKKKAKGFDPSRRAISR
jgi:hypothetical protein